MSENIQIVHEQKDPLRALDYDTKENEWLLVYENAAGGILIHPIPDDIFVYLITAISERMDEIKEVRK